MSSEVIESTKNTIKERLNNPFYGKLILSWFLWNWKILYVTFFVKEDNLETNKVEYIIHYFNDNSIFFVHIIPILITALLIWGLPYVTHEAYKATEKFRKKKALRKKKTDEEITNYLDINIQELNNRNQKSNDRIQELRLLSKYLSEERDYLVKQQKKPNISEFSSQLQSIAKNENNKIKLFSLIDNHNKAWSTEQYLRELDSDNKDFMFNNLIIDHDKEVLSKFGKFVSKYKLIYKYKSDLIGFSDYYRI